MVVEVILHIRNLDPIIGEIDELPEPDDQLLKVVNPRFRDGRELHFLDHGVDTVIWPIAQLSFIEILTSEDEEDIIGFVRE
ncbi:MAG: hypothetical protein U9Q82_14650 [Chloroflexota bacterium]|nr:hypothetical protein [Chloroflexota bacterium]